MAISRIPPGSLLAKAYSDPGLINGRHPTTDVSICGDCEYPIIRMQNSVKNLAGGPHGVLRGANAGFKTKRLVCLNPSGTTTNGSAVTYDKIRLSGELSFVAKGRWFGQTATTTYYRFIDAKSVWSATHGFYISMGNTTNVYIRGSSSTQVSIGIGETPSNGAEFVIAGTFDASGTVRIWWNGVYKGSASVAAISGTPNGICFGHGAGNNDYGWSGSIEAMIFDRVLPDRLIEGYSRNFYSDLEAANATPFLYSTGGATTHTSSGSLASSAASISGSADVARDASGALSSDASSISASSAVSRDASGSIASSSAVLSGVSAVSRESSGSLAQGDSSVTGSASVTPAGSHSSAGVLSAQGASIAGAAVVGRSVSGALSANASSISASGLVSRDSAGALSAQASTMAGSASIPSVATSAGSLSCSLSSMSGAFATNGWSDVPQSGASWIDVAEESTTWTDL